MWTETTDVHFETLSKRSIRTGPHDTGWDRLAIIIIRKLVQKE